MGETTAVYRKQVFWHTRCPCAKPLSDLPPTGCGCSLVEIIGLTPTAYAGGTGLRYLSIAWEACRGPSDESCATSVSPTFRRFGIGERPTPVQSCVHCTELLPCCATGGCGGTYARPLCPDGALSATTTSPLFWGRTVGGGGEPRRRFDQVERPRMQPRQTARTRCLTGRSGCGGVARKRRSPVKIIGNDAAHGPRPPGRGTARLAGEDPVCGLA